jgi:hypothetical protein
VLTRERFSPSQFISYWTSGSSVFGPIAPPEADVRSGQTRRFDMFGSMSGLPQSGRPSIVIDLTDLLRSGLEQPVGMAAVFRVACAPAQPAGHNLDSPRPFPHHRKNERSRYSRPGMGRVVSSSRRIRVLLKTTTNRHDLPRAVLLDPLLDQVNCVREPADQGRVDHCGCPYLATAWPADGVRRSGSPPQGRRGFPSAHR